MPVSTYRAPIEDYRFILHDWLRVQDRHDLPGFAELTRETTGALLDAAATFFEDVLHPIGQKADEQGATLRDGRVFTPEGYRQAWQVYRDGGWLRLTLDPALGGEGLPRVLAVPMSEMGSATGHSFMMYGAFCPSAARVLAALGEPWMREHVVPALVEGRWTATMCMTEPQAGTDLRQISTRAVAQPDGTFRLHGSKIFISGGDHDLTENIVHIVLAKIPEPDGSLRPGLGSVNVFMVPACLVDQQTGALAQRNAIEVTAVEHKMGIGGSATCALRFDGAVAWRIGAPASGGTASNMAGMFMMMNTARLGTAMSGVAYSEIAYQNASAYARERLSGRSPAGARRPELAADPIIVHPDVRRLLLDARAFIEGGRATALRVSFLQAVSTGGADAQERERAGDIVELLTPVLKAYFTDKGFAATNDCMQVLGGHGYVRDWGMERFVRNARIGQIYEGANGVQAMDLVNRKLTAKGGRPFQSFIAAIEQTLSALPQTAHGRLAVTSMQSGLAHLKAALAAMQAQGLNDPHAAGAAAYDLLTMFGIVTIGWTWAELACVEGAPESKQALARVWFTREMPLLAALRARIEAGPASLCELADEAV